MRAKDMLRRAWQAGARSLGVFVRDVGRGMLEVSHNTLALVGLAAVAVLVFGLGRAELRQQAESIALEWLRDRHEQREQAAVAGWIARRYKVAPEPIGALVQEAWAIGQRAGLDPTLILAIMAVESSFNPFAQSSVGAQGLMQVLTRVHDDKYEAFGGTHAAFDPIANLRVGVQVLKECIARAGSLQEGLRYYVGAALQEHDGGYIGRVLAEQTHLRNVADGKRVPVNAPNAAAAPLPAPSARPIETVAEPPSTPPLPAAPTEPQRDDRVALLR